MPATVAGIHLGPDTHANRPAANASGLPVGSLYMCSDHSLIYKTNGSAWSTWATLGGDVSAHTADATDAHDASAISIADAGGHFTGTDVEAALQELGAGGGGGGGSAWTQVVDESGASFANWTSVSGTWSSDGAVIRQTDLGARHARYTAKVPSVGLLYEGEVRFPTGSLLGSNHSLGLVLGHDGSTPLHVGLLGSYDNGLPHTGITVGDDWSGSPRRIMTGTSAVADTWYKLRFLLIGRAVSAWEDGTFLGSFWYDGSSNANADYIGLFARGINPAQFRNIKAWTLTLPA